MTSTAQAIGRKQDGKEETLEQVFIGMEKKEENFTCVAKFSPM